MAESGDKALKDRLARVEKLFTLLREIQAKEYEVTEEIGRILGGAESISVVMKGLEQAFDAAWCVRYAPGQTGRYVWQFVRDRPHWKRLLKTLPADEIRARMVIYLQNDDLFYLKARHSFGLFVSSINAHAAPVTAPFTLDAPTIAGCKHQPPCPSDQAHTEKWIAEMRQTQSAAR